MIVYVLLVRYNVFCAFLVLFLNIYPKIGVTQIKDKSLGLLLPFLFSITQFADMALFTSLWHQQTFKFQNFLVSVGLRKLHRLSYRATKDYFIEDTISAFEKSATSPTFRSGRLVTFWTLRIQFGASASKMSGVHEKQQDQNPVIDIVITVQVYAITLLAANL